MMRTHQGLAKAASFAAVPWNGFVAAFVYYTVLTLIIISGTDVAYGFMIAAYPLPLLAYTGLLLARGVRAVAAVQIDLVHTPRAIAR